MTRAVESHPSRLSIAELMPDPVVRQTLVAEIVASWREQGFPVDIQHSSEPLTKSSKLPGNFDRDWISINTFWGGPRVRGDARHVLFDSTPFELRRSVCLSAARVGWVRSCEDFSACRSLQWVRSHPIWSPNAAATWVCEHRSPGLGKSKVALRQRVSKFIYVGVVTIRLGLQIANYSDGNGVDRLFPSVIAQAQEAESAGFDTLLLMDHFYQLPQLGAPEDPMLEAYTALGALASLTERVQLGALVTGNTYRNPAMLAKIITTLDVISGGRAILGIGAGWYELEHVQLGYEFATFGDRFDRLEEALGIIVPMLRGERPTVIGKWYRTDSALACPRLRDDIPIMLGGSGENRTFRLAARHAQHLNLLAPFDQLKRKRDVLASRCEEIGRDPATLETSTLVIVRIDDSPGQSEPQAAEAAPLAAGSLDQIADLLKINVLDAGVDSIIISLPSHRYTPGLISAVGETLRPMMDSHQMAKSSAV